MPSEFEDPELAPIRAQEIGPRKILHWAFLTAAAGAVVAWLGPVLWALGIANPPTSLVQPGGGDGAFVLQFLSSIAPPFVAVGTGLAVAASVEVRRGTIPIERSTKSILYITWGLLLLTVIGFILPTGNP